MYTLAMHSLEPQTCKLEIYLDVASRLSKSISEKYKGSSEVDLETDLAFDYALSLANATLILLLNTVANGDTGYYARRYEAARAIAQIAERVASTEIWPGPSAFGVISLSPPLTLTSSKCSRSFLLYRFLGDTRTRFTSRRYQDYRRLAIQKAMPAPLLNSAHYRGALRRFGSILLFSRSWSIEYLGGRRTFSREITCADAQKD